MPAFDLLIASSDATLLRRLAQGLRRVPDVRRIQQARDRAGVERVLTTLNPSVLLLDLPMAGFGRLDSVEKIRILSPTTQTILLVDSLDDSAAVQALKDGARGYCSRNTEPALLRKAIQLVRQGEIWVGRRVILRLIEELTTVHRSRAGRASRQGRLLTDRQRQIASLVAAGASNKEIADRLSIAERTVKAHLSNIFQKLGLSSRLHLAMYARDTKLAE